MSYLQYLGFGWLSSQRPGGSDPNPNTPTVTTRYEETVVGNGLNQIQFSAGQWNPLGKGTFSGGNGMYSIIAGATVTMIFQGTGIGVAAEKFPAHGIASFSVDGQTPQTVDLYAPAEVPPAIVWQSPALPDGQHTLVMTVTGNQNIASSGMAVTFDYIEVKRPQTLAAQWWVGGPGASDSTQNGQSQSTPFATIQRALNSAQTGDTIMVRGAGAVYRETPVFINDGVTIQSMPGEARAKISGLETLGGWVQHSGNIYKAPMSNGAMFNEYRTGFNINNWQYNNTQLLAQQLFKDGNMQFLASWPKPTSPDNLLDRSSYRSTVNVGTFGSTQVTDSGFAQFGAGALNGGVIRVQGWFIMRTRNITAQSGNTLTYQDTGDNGDHAFSKFFRVINRLGLLTQAKEWHYDGSFFYYWQPGGGVPTGMEYKKRNYGFDARGKSNITIKGFEFIGCNPIWTNSSSSAVVLDNIRASYVSHHELESNGGNNGYLDSAVQTGSILYGTGSEIKNSEFNYGSGVTVWLGPGARVTNCKFQNSGYGGFYGGAVRLTWDGLTGSANNRIYQSSFDRCGRAHIEMTADAAFTSYANLEIGFCDFKSHARLNCDTGAIYGARKTIWVNGRIHHCWFHDSGHDEAGTGQERGIQVTGNYWDQASGPADIDHCVHWNGVSGVNRSGAYSADYYTQSVWIERKSPQWPAGEPSSGKARLVHNIYATATGGGQYATVVYNNDPTVKDIHRNNIYRAGVNQDWGQNGAAPDMQACLRANIVNGTNTDFENPSWVGGSLSTPQIYFGLQPTSKAINLGIILAPLTNGYVAPAPDAGAYEYSQTPWVPGYTEIPYTL